jgi:hypothetical protein
MYVLGIVSEGITDQIVLAGVLYGFAASEGCEFDVIGIEPEPNPSGTKQVGRGGWERVFGWLRSGRHRDALQTQGLSLVLHVDTDQCEHPNFGVSRRVDGRERTIEELVAAVRERLIELIGRELYATSPDRFLFAISVEEVECWLLPFFAEPKKHASTRSCWQIANDAIKEVEGAKSLPWGLKKEHPFEGYRRAKRCVEKHKSFRKAMAGNPSLAIFFQSLAARFETK